jgi:hypothetical protein
MEEIICTIYLGVGILDNDYIFYEDGRILNKYDAYPHPSRSNLTRWVTANDISEPTKNKLIEKCSEDHKDLIHRILYPS